MQAYGWFIGYVAINMPITTLLAWTVSYRRMTLKVANGDGGRLEMKQAIRAHANSVEHVTVFGFIVLGLSLISASAILQGLLVTAFSISRLLHALGMLRSMFTFRRLGAGITYLAEVVGCLSLFAYLALS